MSIQPPGWRTQRRRLKNLATLLLANVFTAGVGFITTVTIANTLGSARFGQLAYALAIGNILAVNVRFGMDRSLIRDLSHFPERFNETLAASMLARGFLLVLCLCGLLLMALPIAGLDVSGGMFLIILATALMPFQIANVFDIWESQGRHALYVCVERALYFGVIWAVIFWSPERLDLAWIGFALLVAALVFLSLQYRHAWGRIRPTFRAMPLGKVTRAALKLLASNKWLWLANVAVLGLTVLNQVVLKQFAGLSELGVFAACLQLVSLATLLLKNIARIGRPILAQYTAPDAVNPRATARFLALYLAAGGVAVGLIALPAIAVPDLILKTLFTAEYVSGAWVLRILGVYLLLRVFDIILGQYLVFVRMDFTCFASSVAAGLVGLVGAMLLIPPFAAIGAALALVAGETVLVVICVFATLIQMKRLAAPSSVSRPEGSTSAETRPVTLDKDGVE